MLQPDTIQTLNDSTKALPDSLARLDSLALVDSLHVTDTLKAIVQIPRGFIGIPHPSLPQTESWVFLVLLGFFFLLVYAVSQSSGYITETAKTFFKVKERSSIFSKATVNDFRFRFFLIIFTIGVLSLYAYLIQFKVGSHFLLKEYGCFFVVTTLFVILKHFSFNLIGYVFLPPAGLRMAKESYLNVVSFLGIVLYPLLILQIYIPSHYASFAGIASLSVCFIACILVIIKLFQIFLHKFVASFYILLYLCTLEILPLVLLYQVYQFALKIV